jgi:hypothetical protein
VGEYASTPTLQDEESLKIVVANIEEREPLSVLASPAHDAVFPCGEHGHTFMIQAVTAVFHGQNEHARRNGI